jgi:cytoskeletal protein RodZ
MLTPIGQTLKAARERRGLSLLDAAHETRIPVARLHLLEQDNYAAFGSMTYARSFLRRYSQFLEVDASPILHELPGGVLGGPRDYRYLTENHGLWVVPRGQRLGHLSQAATKGRSRRSPVPAGLFIFVLVLAGTGIWGKYVAEDRLAQQKVEATTRPLAEAPAPPLSARANSSVNAAAEPTKILKAIPVTEEEAREAHAGNPGRVE